MRAEGGTYFFTVVLASLRASTLEDHIDVLRDACRMVQQTRPVNIDAMIILRDYLDDVRSLAEGVQIVHHAGIRLVGSSALYSVIPAKAGIL